MYSEKRIPVEAIKGRGAATRMAHRFERDERHAFDDGWEVLDADGEVTRPATEVIWEDARSLITTKQGQPNLGDAITDSEQALS